MSNGRTVPPRSAEARTLEITLSDDLTIGDIIELEEALATGVKQMVAWLVAKKAVDEAAIRALPWAQMAQLRERLRDAVQQVGQVPPERS